MAVVGAVYCISTGLGGEVRLDDVTPKGQSDGFNPASGLSGPQSRLTCLRSRHFGWSQMKPRNSSMVWAPR